MTDSIHLNRPSVEVQSVYCSNTNKVTLKKGSVLAIDPSAACPKNIKRNYRTADDLLRAKSLKKRNSFGEK